MQHIGQESIEEYERIVSAVSSNGTFFNVKLVEWKERANAMDRLTAFVTSHTEVVNRSKKFITVVDAFSKGLADNNSKVLFAAQKAFIKTIPLLKVRFYQGNSFRI